MPAPDGLVDRTKSDRIPDKPEGLTNGDSHETSKDEQIDYPARPSTEIPQHIRIKNRRRRYLELHPEYFGPGLELADPLLYDRLVRRFQTPAERESEGRKKGYSGVLEADLYRSEAKMDALRNPDLSAVGFSYKRGPDGEILAEEKDDVPLDKEDGLERWKWEMGNRFVAGKDEDFDYVAVDEDGGFDDRVVEERDEEERWFDDQTPEFVGGEEGRLKEGEVLKGETGVQDF